jgi:hypothetical protein
MDGVYTVCNRRTDKVIRDIHRLTEIFDFRYDSVLAADCLSLLRLKPLIIKREGLGWEHPLVHNVRGGVRSDIYLFGLN